MNLEDERKQWEREALKKPLPDGILCVEESISGVGCVWVCSEKSDKKRVVLYLHGGGLVSGSALTHLNIAAEMTISFEIPVLLVNYRLLPENMYPAPLLDTLLVYSKLIEEKRFTPEQVVFGGDSSGGGLVLAGLAELKKYGKPLPRRAFAVSGTFDMTLSGESMSKNACSDPVVSFEELKVWQKEYLIYDLKSPLLSPIYADLSGLPPVLLLSGGKEPWLSDSIAISHKIEIAKGRAQLQVWKSMGHVWIADAELKESREALNLIHKFIR